MISCPVITYAMIGMQYRQLRINLISCQCDDNVTLQLCNVIVALYYKYFMRIDFGSGFL